MEKDVFGLTLIEDIDRAAVTADLLDDTDAGIRFKIMRRPEAASDENDLILFLPEHAEDISIGRDDRSVAYLNEIETSEFGSMTSVTVPDAEGDPLWFGLKAAMEWHRLRREELFHTLKMKYVDAHAAALKCGAREADLRKIRTLSTRDLAAHVAETVVAINELAFRVLDRILEGELTRIAFLRPKEITREQALRYVVVEAAESIERRCPGVISERDGLTRLHVLAAAANGAVPRYTKTKPITGPVC